MLIKAIFRILISMFVFLTRGSFAIVSRRGQFVLLLIALFCSMSVSAADPPTFYSRLMEKSAIQMEQSPYIMIWIDGGREDDSRLKTNGDISQSQWEDIFEHVGHLYPYICRRYYDAWGTGAHDTYIYAGINVGLPLAGTVGQSLRWGFETAEQIMINYWCSRYRTPLGLAIKYWFHDLESPDNINTPEAREFFKTWFVDEIEAARDEYAEPYPILYSNWLVPHGFEDGEFQLWQNGAGITHGNGQLYYKPGFGVMECDKDNLGYIFRRSQLYVYSQQVECQDFYSMWVGNAGNDDDVLTPAQYGPLVSLGALMGCRWFIPYTFQNNGSLANASESNPTTIANINADCFYSMAKAASWFQQTSPRFLESVPDVVMYDGSAEASGNALHIAGTGPCSDVVRTSLPEVLTALNQMDVGEHELVLSWDIKAIDGPLSVNSHPRFNDMRITGDNSEAGTNNVLTATAFYKTGNTKYIYGNDTFIRQHHHVKFKIVAGSPSSDDEFVQNSFTDFRFSFSVVLASGENFTVDVDNIFIKTADGTILNPSWNFESTPGTDLLPLTSMQTVSTSNVAVTGRNGGNGVIGLPEQATFAARVSPDTKHYWFSGYQPTGTSNVIIPLPFPYGRLENMATGQTWNETNGLITVSIGQSGDLYFFRPVLNPAWNFDGARSVSDLIPESAFVNGYTEVADPIVTGYGHVARLKNSTGHDYTYPSLSIDQAVNAFNSYTSSDGTVTFTLSADIKGVNDGGSGATHPRITTLRIFGDNSDPQNKYVISTYLVMQPVAYDGEFYHVSQQFTLKFVDSNPSATNEFVAGSITGVDIKFETDSDGVETQWAEFDNIEICAE